MKPLDRLLMKNQKPMTFGKRQTLSVVAEGRKSQRKKRRLPAWLFSAVLVFFLCGTLSPSLMAQVPIGICDTDTFTIAIPDSITFNADSVHWYKNSTEITGAS
ncbi:MAG: hypothetical protein WAS72_08515, partial [Saprospiraceae bacterium]